MSESDEDRSGSRAADIEGWGTYSDVTTTLGSWPMPSLSMSMAASASAISRGLQPDASDPSRARVSGTVRTGLRCRCDDGHAFWPAAGALCRGRSQLVEQSRHAGQDDERLLPTGHQVMGDIDDAELEALDLCLPSFGAQQPPAGRTGSAGVVNTAVPDRRRDRQRRLVHLGQPLAERHVCLYAVSLCDGVWETIWLSA
jgi:hypothetical protein